MSLLKSKKTALIFIVIFCLLTAVIGCTKSATQTQEKKQENTPKNTATASYPTGRIYTADEDGNTVSVIDTAENKVVKSVEVKSMPHNVQISPDGKQVWVTVVQPGMEGMSGMSTSEMGASGMLDKYG